jgi:hypothetical protein
MTTMSKRSLISESIVTIRIGVHSVGEEPEQHVIRLAPWVSHTTTLRKVPTRSKSGLCSRDEILIPTDHLARPSSWATSVSLHKSPRRREGWFDKVVTKLPSLSGPIKSNMWSVQFKAYPSRPK